MRNLKQNRTNKKRTVEIYFVLYLAALVFLLPDGKKKGEELNHTTNYVSQIPFHINAEKSNLSAKLSIDSLGVRIITLDSINNIFYSGDVKDVKFEFVILDNTLKQSLHLSSNEANAAKYFRLFENKDKRLISFFWKPSLQETINKNYTVQIIASAKPLNDESGFVLRDKTQFGLNVIVENAVAQAGISGSATDTQQSVFSIIDSIKKADFFSAPASNMNYDMIVEKDLVRAIAYQKWTNTINAYNINLTKDLAQAPKVTATEYDGKIPQIDAQVYNDRIVLSGRTPAYGRYNVRLSIVRKSDNKEQTVSFNVMPIPLEQPLYERTMYPGKAYIIDPKLPLADKDTRAYLKYQNQIRARSSQGEKFAFTPDFSDTGKTFVLERYIDNQIIGEEYRIAVSSFPEPEIIEIQQLNQNEIRIKTKSYGMYYQESNLVGNFEINGNGTFRELFGSLTEDKEKFTHIQTFVFTRKNAQQPFNFSIKAVDKLGRKSDSRTYSGE